MTRGFVSSDAPSLFSAKWEGQEQQGETPEAGGRTATEARRDKDRKRKMMPSERRRRERKITLRISSDLVTELRAICANCHHIRPDGQGELASSLLELLLAATIQRYREGSLRLTQIGRPAAIVQLQWQDGAAPAAATPAVPLRPERTAITLTLSESLIKSLRQLGKEFGHVGANGNGRIASAVVELFLAAAVAVYRQGGLALVEGTVAVYHDQLVWNR